MYVFVDESGTNKQTGVCVFAAVLVEPGKLETLDKLIVTAEQKAGVRNFHWKDTPLSLRVKFMRVVAKGEFVVKYQYSKNPLSNFGDALESLLITASAGLTIERIVLDGRKDKSYERQLKKILRDKGLSSKRLRTANDESYPALRLADGVAGLIRAHANKPTDETAAMMKALSKRLQ